MRASLWAAVITAIVLLGGAWLVVRAEASAPRATITSFPLAVWWSIETATTVGYGDMYPVTAWGRVIACVVMFVGIALFGIVTAALATWFVGGAARSLRVLGGTLKHAEYAGREDASDEVRALHERFDRLERLLREGGGRSRTALRPTNSGRAVPPTRMCDDGSSGREDARDEEGGEEKRAQQDEPGPQARVFPHAAVGAFLVGFGDTALGRRGLAGRSDDINHESMVSPYEAFRIRRRPALRDHSPRRIAPLPGPFRPDHHVGAGCRGQACACTSATTFLSSAARTSAAARAAGS